MSVPPPRKRIRILSFRLTQRSRLWNPKLQNQSKGPNPSAAVVKDSDANTFTGSIKDGYPDGTGTFTFVKARRIDMHDEEARVAEAGDYIYGNWTDGHLNYGTWYAADGTEKGFIKIGDCPNVELDHQLGKCVHLP